MGYQDHHDPDPVYEEVPAGGVLLVFGLAVRLLGVALLLAGLWAGVSVLLEAWGLYQEPERIERFAQAVERGSNLDAVFAPRPGEVAAAPAVSDELSGPVSNPRPEASPDRFVRLSYFAGWFVALLLLFIIGMLAMAAVSTGGQLALGEPRLRRARRVAVREVRRIRSAA